MYYDKIYKIFKIKFLIEILLYFQNLHKNPQFDRNIVNTLIFLNLIKLHLTDVMKTLILRIFFIASILKKWKFT